jgi:hypothetical protein
MTANERKRPNVICVLSEIKLPCDFIHDVGDKINALIELTSIAFKHT